MCVLAIFRGNHVDCQLIPEIMPAVCVTHALEVSGDVKQALLGSFEHSESLVGAN